MNNSVTLFRLELKHLWRQGIFAAFLFLGLVLVPVLTLLPAQWHRAGLFLILYVDAALAGFLFSGGLTLLENGQNLRPALEIIPGARKTILLLRIASFALLAGVVSLLVFTLAALMLPGSISPASALYLSCFLIIGSVPSTVLGMIAAENKESTNGFLLGAIPAMFLFLPALILLFLSRDWTVVFLSFVLPGGGAVLAARAEQFSGEFMQDIAGIRVFIISGGVGLANTALYSWLCIRRYLKRPGGL
ncbi:hypothetical protein [Salinispira pacifica]|uniref:Uncharacterized protein n=1 Tax=Salinispira pacifica TaxID=1307761 RepID=V5WEW6_9SPIO|nr:hypothetical protein [Salinispira pacifica]AHC14175.1 hypothetical protein L21SP2_0750 [Salinispira pacifica]